jgi:hypothetical protein
MGGAGHAGLADGSGRGGFEGRAGFQGGHGFGHRGEGARSGHLAAGAHPHERGEHRLAGLAQNSPRFNNFGAYADRWDFEWSPFSECPPYDPNNIGQNFGCAHPVKRMPRDIR